MRTITLLLTMLVSQMSAAYIPSTVYVQRNSMKTSGVHLEKSSQSRDDAAKDTNLLIPEIGESRTLSTAGESDLSTDLYDLNATAGKTGASAGPMRNCCITGK